MYIWHICESTPEIILPPLSTVSFLYYSLYSKLQVILIKIKANRLCYFLIHNIHRQFRISKNNTDFGILTLKLNLLCNSKTIYLHHLLSLPTYLTKKLKEQTIGMIIPPKLLSFITI